jgi:hypothetical protein
MDSPFDQNNWALNSGSNPKKAVISLVSVGLAGAAIFYATGQFPGESALMLGAKTAGSVFLGLALPILVLKNVLPWGG